MTTDDTKGQTPITIAGTYFINVSGNASSTLPAYSFQIVRNAIPIGSPGIVNVGPTPAADAPFSTTPVVGTLSVGDIIAVQLINTATGSNVLTLNSYNLEILLM
jgi:hypothetical protein